MLRELVGFAPTFGASGLAPTTGGLDFEVMGEGGLEANALDGRELAGELSEIVINLSLGLF